MPAYIIIADISSAVIQHWHFYGPFKLFISCGFKLNICHISNPIVHRSIDKLVLLTTCVGHLWPVSRLSNKNSSWTLLLDCWLVLTVHAVNSDSFTSVGMTRGQSIVCCQKIIALEWFFLSPKLNSSKAVWSKFPLHTSMYSYGYCSS